MNASNFINTALTVKMFFVNGFENETREVAAIVTIDKATATVVNVLSQSHKTVDNFDGTVETIDAAWFNKHAVHQVAEICGVAVELPF